MGFLRRAAEPLDVEAAYDLWAPRYPPEAHNHLMGLEQGAVLALLPDLRGRRALDAGCGSGRYVRLLEARGAALVVGVDLSRAMVARARAVSTRLARADVAALPLRSGSFDVAVCGLVVGHLARLGSALAELARVLAPGGVLVYSDVHPMGAEAGWERGFRGQDGRRYVAPHHVHSRADHERACSSAGLAIEDVREPRVEIEGRWRGHPAALVVRARAISR